jgi:repressor LexA
MMCERGLFYLNSMNLTARQREILNFIRSVELQRGAGPTTREVQQHFGFASQTAAVDHIRALEKKGALRKTAGTARAITTSPPKTRLVHVPIFGYVPAGIPELVEQEPDGFVLVDAVAAGISKNATLFATHVRGDSMINAGIFHGDIGVCEMREALPGQVVAALIDGETTLKTFVKERGKPFLRAENPKYPNLIPARELLIQGVLVHLQRNLLTAAKKATKRG